MNLTIIKRVTIIFIPLLTVVLVGLFFFQHGYVTVKIDSSTVQSIEYTPLERNAGSTTTKEVSKQLSSGLYAANISLKNGDSYVEQIRVPRFLKSVSITPKTSTNELKTVALKTNSWVGNINKSSLISFDYNGQVQQSSRLT